MKRFLLVISLIIIVLSANAQSGDYHVYIHGKANAGGTIWSAPVVAIDSMYVSENGKLKVRTNSDLSSFEFSEIDSLTFPWVPTATGDVVEIFYNGTTATCNNPFPNVVNVTVNGAKVSISANSTDYITYCLSGTSNQGRFEVESSASSPIVKLNGVNLTNPTGKAMDLTCDAGIILEIADGTTNSLRDGTESDKKAALMSNNSLLVRGEGTLTVTGFVQHAMKVKGQFTMNSGNIIIANSVMDGIHTEGLLIQGGNINIQSCGDDGLTSELDGYINGGNITITSASEDINGISADSTLVINGGVIDINLSGADANCIKADKELTINGGTFVLNNSGNVSKGIKSNSTITITNGDITITSSGGTVVTNYDPSYCSAIKGDTDIIISGGTFHITLPTSNNGGKGISCDGNMTISGNSIINIETHGDGATYTASTGTDTYSSSCLRAEGNMQILSGDITLTSTGKAGKGIKVGKKNGNTYSGTYTQGNTDGSGPTITINTTGAQVGSSGGGGWPPPGGGGSSSTASAKAIKVGGIATIYGGTTTVTTAQKGAEGLESKTQINIEGGQHYFKCYDDCINSSGKIFFNGGVTVCFSNGNDAVDSNAGQAGAITIGNGVAFAYTTKGSPEEGFDCDNNNYIRITGTGIGISAGGSQGGGWPGGGGSGGTITNPAQGYAFYTNSYSFQAGKYYTLSNASGTNGNNMVTFSFESNCTSNLALITATGMISGQTYYVKHGTTAPTNPTTSFHGLYLGGTSSASTQAFNFQAQ